MATVHLIAVDVCMCACSVMSDSFQPHGIFPVRVLEWAAISSSIAAIGI